MGLLRILLALGVALEHSDYFLFAGSYTAVQVFFMISGFYMALMYGTRYQSPMPFYASRALRLLPAYWIAIIFYLLYSAIGSAFGLKTFVDYWNHAFPLFTSYDWLLFTFSNIFILGSDAVWFIAKEHLVTQVPHPVHLLVVPPIWTVSLEMMFYLLCPWLAKRRTASLIGIAGLIFAIRFISYTVWGLNTNPWHARFFPFELLFFVSGMITARIYKHHQEKILCLWRDHKKIVIALLAVYYGLVVCFYFLTQHAPIISVYGMNTAFVSLVIYVASIGALPIIFAISQHSEWDRIIGELSYPIYIMHYIFVILFHHNNLFPTLSNGVIATIIVGLSLVHGWLIYAYVQKPVDHYRLKRFTKSLE